MVMCFMVVALIFSLLISSSSPYFSIASFVFVPSKDSSMSRPQDPPRSFLSFGNSFRMMLTRVSSLPPKMLHLLNTFEQNLAGRLCKLKPSAGSKDFLSFSWMTSAMESLCEIHADLELLVVSLELPICNWKDRWIEAYFDDSVKLLNISNILNHEILRLKQGHLHLLCALHNPNPFLDVWDQHMSSKNSKLDRIFSIMDDLAQTLDRLKIKNSPKEEVLMQAMYGVKVVSFFICSVFSAAFFGSAKRLVDVRVVETCSWAEAFGELQSIVNTEIRSCRDVAFLKELAAIETGVKKLHVIMLEKTIDDEGLQDVKSDMEQSMEKLHQGLDLLAKEVNGFFGMVLSGRNALLSDLRLAGNVSEQGRSSGDDNVEELKARVLGEVDPSNSHL